MLMERLKELCDIDGVSGFEDDVRKYLLEQVKPHADQVIVDPLGSLLVFKKGKHSRKRPMMICAHMDEVGYLISEIGDDGMIRLANVGRIDPKVLIGRRMRMGGGVRGVVALKAIHLTTAEERRKIPPLPSLFLDIGAFFPRGS